MALVTRGNFDDLDVRFSPKVADIPGVESLRTAGEAREATRRVQEADLVIPKSPEPRGLSLKSIVLKRGFEGYLGNIWNKKNEVFFVSHSYDLSASTPYVHPEKDADPSEYVISLRAGEMRELFMGSGAMLFPLRQVSSGIVVRLHIWESDEGSRSFGEAMVKVANTVEDSDLNAALKALSLANPTVAAIDGIKTAATTLSTLIGGILKENGDDFVDYYEGNYPVSKTWSPGDETYERDDSTIVVTRI